MLILHHHWVFRFHIPQKVHCLHQEAPFDHRYQGLGLFLRRKSLANTGRQPFPSATGRDICRRALLTLSKRIRDRVEWLGLCLLLIRWFSGRVCRRLIEKGYQPFGQESQRRFCRVAHGSQELRWSHTSWVFYTRFDCSMNSISLLWRCPNSIFARLGLWGFRRSKYVHFSDILSSFPHDRTEIQWPSAAFGVPDPCAGRGECLQFELGLGTTQGIFSGANSTFFVKDLIEIGIESYLWPRIRQELASVPSHLAPALRVSRSHSSAHSVPVPSSNSTPKPTQANQGASSSPLPASWVASQHLIPGGELGA